MELSVVAKPVEVPIEVPVLAQTAAACRLDPELVRAVIEVEESLNRKLPREEAASSQPSSLSRLAASVRKDAVDTGSVK